MPGDRNYEVKGPIEERFDEILTPDALGFVADLHRRFNATRKELLARRVERQARFDAGETARLPARDEAHPRRR